MFTSRRIKKRFDAESIPCQIECSASRVIDRQGKHSAQLLNTVGSHLFIEVNDNFGIRLRVEAMTIPLEFSTEFVERAPRLGGRLRVAEPVDRARFGLVGREEVVRAGFVGGRGGKGWRK